MQRTRSRSYGKSLRIRVVNCSLRGHISDIPSEADCRGMQGRFPRRGDCLRNATSPVITIAIKTMARAIVVSFFPAFGLPTITNDMRCEFSVAVLVEMSTRQGQGRHENALKLSFDQSALRACYGSNQIWPGSSGSGSRTGTSGFSGGSIGSWTGGGIGSAGARNEYRVGLFILLLPPSQMMASRERKPAGLYLGAPRVQR